jgi:heme/copper-type cytochrome/quinol oxidase subunit 3
MSITTTEHDPAGPDDHDDHGHGHGPAVEGAENPGGEHETAFKRDQKERLLMWLFISGDALFLVLEVFTWFYLRTLNTSGLWNGAACTKVSPCADGLANPITAPITKADPKHAIIIAVLTVVSAAFVWAAESAAKKGSGKRSVSTMAGLSVVFVLAAVAWQIYQFQVLPFTTIDGSYASTYEFFMGSTLAHLILLAFILIGLWIRSSRGRYEGQTWYRVRLIRFFAVWIAVSTVVLVTVGALFY